ncbi:uncharacterized protein C8Q71DRAFT_19332 [Rhodofomes roseus]|uniref:Uncharacterized protein n=1 Tax=Rhodofomes roseus TaxID=34475 RepID=A0ABQ8KX91_9APHY|nr:uncharacterized protein C8Q71DRAFT_19332 [Rhodofomes roseus]KAH9843917.1 hypothetical protein C8Q71DRAFT_19332 [Rhodofomes roseus]
MNTGYPPLTTNTLSYCTFILPTFLSRHACTCIPLACHRICSFRRFACPRARPFSQSLGSPIPYHPLALTHLPSSPPVPTIYSPFNALARAHVHALICTLGCDPLAGCACTQDSPCVLAVAVCVALPRPGLPPTRLCAPSSARPRPSLGQACPFFPHARAARLIGRLCMLGIRPVRSRSPCVSRRLRVLDYRPTLSLARPPSRPWP